MKKKFSICIPVYKNEKNLPITIPYIIQHLDLCLDVLSDMILNAKFDDEEIEKEKGVVIEEINMSNRQKNSHTNKGGVYMAISSITKNFIISGQKQVEKFADAIETSANDRTARVPINVTYLQGVDAVVKFMEKRKKTDVINK